MSLSMAANFVMAACSCIMTKAYIDKFYEPDAGARIKGALCSHEVNNLHSRYLNSD